MRGMRAMSVLLMLTVGLVAAGCAETAGAPQKGPGAASQPVMKTSMASGGISGIIYLPAAVAQSAGYFRQQGVDVTSIDMKGGADAAKALIGGSVDFANMSVEHALKAKAQGSDLVIVAGFTRLSGLTLIVDSKLAGKVKSVTDLKGMRVGVTSLGSGTHMALNVLLAKVGLKPSDVEVVAVGTSTMIPAMENGSIQAAFTFDPWATQMVMEKKAFAIFDLATEKDTHWLYGTDYPFTALVTRRDVIAKQPDLVQRMVNAVLDAHAFIDKSDAKSIAMALPAEYRGNLDVYLQSLEHSKPTLSPTGVLTKASLESVYQSLIDSAILPQGTQVDISSVLDMSFVEKAGRR
jgi:NitT/TauT family transport system substrate-binding protein